MNEGASSDIDASERTGAEEPIVVQFGRPHFKRRLRKRR